MKKFPSELLMVLGSVVLVIGLIITIVGIAPRQPYSTAASASASIVAGLVLSAIGTGAFFFGAYLHGKRTPTEKP